jgi:hypothetical protein
MSETNTAFAGVTARLAMMRVWMAISATWVAFWLSIALVVLATGAMALPLDGYLPLFAAIVLAPPLVLLAVGTLVRYTFEFLTSAGDNSA